mgnify:CR=1 FL=1
MELKKNKHTDLTYLIQLSNGSNEFIVQMISIFMVQTPEAIDQMYKYLQNNDWKLLRGIIHKMKPSFSFMGIKELETIAVSAEKYCETETHLEEVPNLIHRIKEVCLEALCELEEEKNQFI